MTPAWPVRRRSSCAADAGCCCSCHAAGCSRSGTMPRISSSACAYAPSPWPAGTPLPPRTLPLLIATSTSSTSGAGGGGARCHEAESRPSRPKLVESAKASSSAPEAKATESSITARSWQLRSGSPRHFRRLLAAAIARMIDPAAASSNISCPGHRSKSWSGLGVDVVMNDDVRLAATAAHEIRSSVAYPILMSPGADAGDGPLQASVPQAAAGTARRSWALSRWDPSRRGMRQNGYFVRMFCEIEVEIVVSHARFFRTYASHTLSHTTHRPHR